MTTLRRLRGLFLLAVTFLLTHLGSVTPVEAVSPPVLVGNFDDRPLAPDLHPRGLALFGDALPPPVRDGNPDPRPPAPDLHPRGLALFGDARVAVLLPDRLWFSDGTEAGTEPLCERPNRPDPRPRPPEGSADCPQVGRLLAGGANGVFFESGERLWFTDGTLGNTLPLTDAPWRFEPGFESEEFLLHPDRGLFFFAAHHPLLGTELWVSDGTRDGTRTLGDLAPGPLSSSPEFGAVAGDRVVFSADDERGREPWITDGTPEGTGLLREIRPGPGSSAPAQYFSLGDRAVFSAEDTLRGLELWVTDGTPEGTEPLPEVVAGPGELFLVFPFESSPLGSAPSRLFFFAQSGPERSLWTTDGTPEGTRELLQLGEQTEGLLSVAGDRAFLAVTDPATGREPWVSDGTPEGTRLLEDVCPGTCSSNPAFFSTFGTHVFLTADDGEAGREPWISDGTPEGTRGLGDLAPGAFGSGAFFFGGNDRRAFFSASTQLVESGLWVTEAPFTTATLLTDPETGRPSGLQARVLLGDDLVGLASDIEHGGALWRSDGTVEGTKPVRTLMEPEEAGSVPSGLSRVGDAVFFATHGSPFLEQPTTLWRTEGTPDTTVPVAEVESAPDGPVRTIQSLTALEDRLVFLLHDEEGRLDLWASGGTPETTRLVAQDIDGFQPDAPLPATREVAFVLGAAFEPGFAPFVPGLWVTDGTPEGTRRLREIHFAERDAAAVFQNRLFFAGALPGTQGDYELWVSDGTPEGTVPFADLHPDGPSNPRDFTPAGDTLYFTAGDFDGRRLWRTDGTPEGTRVVDLPPEAGPGSRPLVALGDRLLFATAVREIFDLEEPAQFTLRALWSTDGTRAGTRRLAEVRTHVLRSRLEPVVVGDEAFFFDFYFSFDLDPSQLWRTDGTPEGTFPWRFLPPDRKPVALHGVDDGLAIEAEGPEDRELWWSGDLSSAELVGAFFGVGEPTRLGDLVLFRGANGRLGFELWAFGVGDDQNRPPVRPVGVPEAPDRLEVFPTGPGGLTAVWRDRSSNETSFVLQARNPLGEELETVAVLPADTTRVRLGIGPALPWTFRVRAENGDAVSDWSAEASGRSHFDLEACVPTDEHLCLLDGRFEVLVSWRDPFNGGQGIGHAVPFDFSDDSGTFWFFEPENVELVAKVLDARTVNGFHWAFYGALSNVEYWVTVRDLLEGTSRTYHNPPANLCGFGDTRAFPRPGPPPPASPDQTVPRVVVEEPELIPPAAISPAIAAGGTGGDGGSCTESDTALCLTAEWFRVEVSWRDPRSGDTGVGFAIPGTDDSGYFWFFDPENVELVVKLLDARTVNGNFWFFYGGLSDVEYTITVTDTVEDVTRTYRNEAFDICGQADTAAF